MRRKGTGFQQPLEAHQHWHIDVSCLNVSGTFYCLCSVLDGYQPIVSLQTGQIDGFEALVRWGHPVRGLIAPREFIPLAEETGLIVPIGEWVLRTACAQASAWVHGGYPHLRASINLSSCQLKQEKLVESVTRALQDTGLARISHRVARQSA